jgi:hypothetical protein
MGGIVSAAVVGAAAIGAYASHEAGKASKKGSETIAEAQREGTALSVDAQLKQLEYLKEINKLPQEYREQALTKLAGGADIGDGPGQQQMIDQAKASPIYGAIMEGQGAGEDAILRSAAATGGLRSGNVQENLAEFSSGLQNTALLTAYNEQQDNLKRLAGLDTGTSQISNVMGNIGTTQGQGAVNAGTALGQGQIASGQIAQQGMQNLSNTALTGLSLGIQSGRI